MSGIAKIRLDRFNKLPHSLRGKVLRSPLQITPNGNDPHSANTQFFINVADNSRLDPSKRVSGGTWGYAVFGSVIQGMEVVDKIVNVQTGPQGPFQRDVPVVPIVIKKMSRYSFE